MAFSWLHRPWRVLMLPRDRPGSAGSPSPTLPPEPPGFADAVRAAWNRLLDNAAGSAILPLHEYETSRTVALSCVALMNMHAD